MSGNELYRRAITRLTISLFFSGADGVICPAAVHNALANRAIFFLVLLLTIPLVWTLTIMWKHTFRDLQYAKKRAEMEGKDAFVRQA